MTSNSDVGFKMMFSSFSSNVYIKSFIMEGTNSQRIKVKMTSSEDLSLLGFQIRLNTADESREECFLKQASHFYVHSSRVLLIYCIVYIIKTI